MKITVANMTQKWGDRARAHNFNLGACDTFGQLRDGHTAICDKAFRAGAQSFGRIVNVMQSLPQRRSVLRFFGPLKS